MNIPIILGIYLAVINLIAFAAYGADKKKAEKKQYRTPEATLILLAAIGGAAGAAVGMAVFHHKTKKPKFYITVPLLLIVEAGLVAWLMIKFWK